MSCEDTSALIVDRLKGQISARRRATARRTLGDLHRLQRRGRDHHRDSGSASARSTSTCRTSGCARASMPGWPPTKRASRSHWTERFLERWWPQQPVLQVGLAAALALVGVLIGQQLPSPVDTEVAALRAEVRTVGLALLDHQSASERLLGVEWSRRTAQTPEVVNALLERVQYDPNLSVRLAAVDALRARARSAGRQRRARARARQAGVAVDAGRADRRAARDRQRPGHRSRARDLEPRDARSVGTRVLANGFERQSAPKPRRRTPSI